MTNKRRIKELRIPIDSTRKYIELFNGIFKLTRTEIIILDEFMKMMFVIRARGLADNVFSTHMKRDVAKKLGRSDPNTLNNYIKSLKDKGAIIINEDEMGYDFHWLLVPLSKHEEIRFIINPVK